MFSYSIKDDCWENAENAVMLLNLTTPSLQNIYQFPHLLPFVMFAFISPGTTNVFKLELLYFWTYNDSEPEWLTSHLYKSCLFSSLGFLLFYSVCKMWMSWMLNLIDVSLYLFALPSFFFFFILLRQDFLRCTCTLRKRDIYKRQHSQILSLIIQIQQVIDQIQDLTPVGFWINKCWLSNIYVHAIVQVRFYIRKPLAHLHLWWLTAMRPTRANVIMQQRL